MKKTFLFLLCILTIFPSIGENSLLTSVLYNGMITINTYEDHYHVTFRLPDYDVCLDTIDIEEYDEIIYDNFNRNFPAYNNKSKYYSLPSSIRNSSEPDLSYFSHICFTTDNFSYMENSGRPQLPYISINIPTLFRETEVIVTIDSISQTTITLPFDYFPTQLGNYLQMEKILTSTPDILQKNN